MLIKLLSLEYHMLTRFSEKELIKSPEFQKKEVPLPKKPDKFIQVTITKKQKPTVKTTEKSKDGDELNSKMYRLGALKFFDENV